MRAPRALIPLLSVCAAAAVVTAAGAGAAIEGLSGGGPALADSASEASTVTVNAMTWNVCGDAEPGCPLGARPAELTRQIAQQMRATEVGGRRVRTDAVFLQRVCSGHVDGLKKIDPFGTWSWAFAPAPKGRACANGQGRLGVAVGTRAALTDVRQVALPSPAGAGRVAVCGEVASWSARVCATQFSAEDGEWRGRQARALANLAGSAVRVVVGGDLAERPESPVLDPLYAAYDECDQGPGGARTGEKTRQDWRGQDVEKNDYLFISKSAGVSCAVPDAPVRASDHRPLSAVIRFH
ncbi:endonuclease/exonuclease/phosphatase family protein [Spirillospora albida]|uniref:endonuclease/exonuclease/phosphatase family protein n=1 Tax=Spirillospora albida TaxID=58123 RepID=UPI0004BF7701|nr:endonuclease/exonuclease/phosphatase family protein [Spirillospora albida]